MPIGYSGLLAAALFAGLTQADDIQLHTGAYSDMGAVVKGMKGRPNQGEAVENLYLSRIGVSLTSEMHTEEGLHMVVGAGGLFWYPLVLPGQWWAKRIQFGPGVSEASFQYDLFAPKNPDIPDEPEGSFIKGGFFGLKYNGDAQNLGEYLLRSECYPGLVQTGGWSFLNSAIHQSLGLQIRLSQWDGKLTHDFVVFSEMERPPIFDMSPTYIGTLHLGQALEWGAGVSLHRFLPIKPSAESPKLRWGGGKQGNTYLIPNPAFIPDSAVSANNRRYIEDTTRFYTLQGIKLMARMSFDVKEIVPALRENMSSRDLRIFIEAAILGVKDYPFYYENIQERMPVMFGIHLPTFRWLELFSVQWEYYRNPWADDQNNFFNTATLLPTQVVSTSAYASGLPKTQVSRDDWKWSVNLVKNLTLGVQLQAQIANDHLRIKDVNLTPTSLPLTQYGNHWYYVVRMQWGL